MTGQAAGSSMWRVAEHLGYTAEVLDLDDVFDQSTDQSAYAFAVVNSDRPQQGFLWLGHDDRARVWLNGDVIVEHVTRRNFDLAGTKIPVSLVAGENRLLVRLGSSSGGNELAAHVVDEDGDRLFGIEFSLPGDVSTAIHEIQSDVLPTELALLGNYPNPFNPATHIRFDLPAASHVELAVYDIAGQRVRTLMQGQLEAGTFEALWDGRDEAGHSAASGVYLAVLRGADFRRTRSMLLLR